MFVVYYSMSTKKYDNRMRDLIWDCLADNYR